MLRHQTGIYRAGVLARQKDGNAVRYSIRLPLVFDLCALVCTSLREAAEAKALSQPRNEPVFMRVFQF